MIVERALAKVNLALHVLGRRADGYHLLDSVVSFADVADVISVAPASHDEFSVFGPFAQFVPTDENNLVLRALADLRQHIFVPPLAVSLEKRLPVAGGIGGGSADAAAMLRACLRISGEKLAAEKLQALALALGADVPVCLNQKISRMGGIGEVVEILPVAPAAAIVLVNPNLGCLTANVFSELGLARNSTYRDGVDLENTKQWRNDLAAPALLVQPVIAEVLHSMELLQTFSTVRMSGSGATCFGLSENLNAAQLAAQSLQHQHPTWWVVAAKLQ